MSFEIQVTGFASLAGSKTLSDEEKAVLLGQTVVLTVNGVETVGSLHVSKSGGLTAQFAVKVQVSDLGEPKAEKVEKPSGLDALKAAAAARIAANAAKAAAALG